MEAVISPAPKLTAGALLLRLLYGYWAQQEGEILGYLSRGIEPASLHHYDLVMSRAMEPALLEFARKGFASLTGGPPPLWLTLSVHRMAQQAARIVNETTIRLIRAAYNRGRLALRSRVKPGEARALVETAVRAIFRNRSRAKKVAETEAARAVQGGRVEALRAQGVRRKVWHTKPGCCAACGKLDGKTVGLDEPFVVLRGLTYGTVYHPPLHPSCFCEVRAA